MAKVILIQGIHITKAGKGTVENMLGTSKLFTKSLAYAEKQKPDKILVLSPYHYLLKLDDIIEKVDKGFKDMTAHEKYLWAAETAKRIGKICDLNNDVFSFLAGKDYYIYLLPYVQHYEIPMEGLRIGEKLHWLNKRI